MMRERPLEPPETRREPVVRAFRWEVAAHALAIAP